MNFGDRLASLREKKKLTQNELAEQTGVSRSRLSLYEIGKREPDIETLSKLADYFEVSIDYLLGKTDIPYIPANTYDPKNPKDLLKFIKQEDVIFDGHVLTLDEKEQLLTALKAIYSIATKKKQTNQ